MPQLGSVRVGDDVEIGANTTIDRGAIEDTVIEDGVKLDNQIQIGHNVRIGAHTAIAGCVGISGSTTIGKRCMIGGHGRHRRPPQHLPTTSSITGCSMVSQFASRKPGYTPAACRSRKRTRWRRIVARFKRLDELARARAHGSSRRAGLKTDQEQDQDDD